jgi:excisionase family DNA binding protein
LSLGCDVPEELMTVQEVADRLKVNADTVRRWLREGQLTGVQLGDRAGYRRAESDLQRFLEARRGASSQNDRSPMP